MTKVLQMETQDDLNGVSEENSWSEMLFLWNKKEWKLIK